MYCWCRYIETWPEYLFHRQIIIVDLKMHRVIHWTHIFSFKNILLPIYKQTNNKISTLPVHRVDQVIPPPWRRAKASCPNTYQHSRPCPAPPSPVRYVVDVWILKWALLNHWRNMESGPRRITTHWRVNSWPSWGRSRVRVCMRRRRSRLRHCKSKKETNKWLPEIGKKMAFHYFANRYVVLDWVAKRRSIVDWNSLISCSMKSEICHAHP